MDSTPQLSQLRDDVDRKPVLRARKRPVDEDVDLLSSSTDGLSGRGTLKATKVEPSEQQQRPVRVLTKRVPKPKVPFSIDATNVRSYGEQKAVTVMRRSATRTVTATGSASYPTPVRLVLPEDEDDWDDKPSRKKAESSKDDQGEVDVIDVHEEPVMGKSSNKAVTCKKCLTTYEPLVGHNCTPRPGRDALTVLDTSDANRIDGAPNMFRLKTGRNRIVPHAALIIANPDEIVTFECLACGQVHHKRVPLPIPCCRDVPVKCRTCHTKFLDSNAAMAKEHRCWNTRATHLFKCTKCDALYEDREELSRHLRNSCHEEELITCDKCHRIFKTRAGFTLHARTCDGKAVTLQNDEAGSQCQRCFLQFADAIQFSKHLQVCGTKCDVCNTLFIDGRVDFTEEERLNALNAHVCESDPRGTLQCDECPLKMRSMRSYVIHKNRHHGTEYAFEERDFNSIEDFNQWRDELAIETGHRMAVARRMNRPTQQYQSKVVYRCVRALKVRNGLPYTEKYASRRMINGQRDRTRVRKMKARAGIMCPAFIYVTQHEDGSVHTFMCLDHSHEPDETTRARLPRSIFHDICALYAQVPSIAYVLRQMETRRLPRPLKKEDVYSVIKSRTFQEKYRRTAVDTDGIQPKPTVLQVAGNYTMSDGGGEATVECDMPSTSALSTSTTETLQIPIASLDFRNDLRTQNDKNAVAEKLHLCIARATADLGSTSHVDYSDEDLEALRAVYEMCTQWTRQADFNKRSALRRAAAARRREEREIIDVGDYTVSPVQRATAMARERVAAFSASTPQERSQRRQLEVGKVDDGTSLEEVYGEEVDVLYTDESDPNVAHLQSGAQKAHVVRVEAQGSNGAQQYILYDPNPQANVVYEIVD